MSISLKRKTLLWELTEKKCEQCKKKFPLSKIEIHRIRRGCQGGTYEDFRNLKVLCKKCHKQIHFEELGIGGRR